MFTKVKKFIVASYFKILGLFDKEHVSCPQCHVQMQRVATGATSYGQAVPKSAYQCPVCYGVQLK